MHALNKHDTYPGDDFFFFKTLNTESFITDFMPIVKEEIDSNYFSITLK